jgi:hypothetical protein
MSPVDYHAWTHRPKALGGTDPIEGMGNEVAILTGWEAISTGEVTADLWTAVTSDGFYNDGYADSEFLIDLDDGTVGGAVKTLYWAQGWIQINETLAQGEVLIGAILNEPEGAGAWIVNQLTAGASGVRSQDKLFVGGPVWNPLTTPSLALYIYHDSASTVSIREATLTVVRLAALDDAAWIAHA